jgi:hypothetical protein
MVAKFLISLISKSSLVLVSLYFLYTSRAKKRRAIEIKTNKTKNLKIKLKKKLFYSVFFLPVTQPEVPVLILNEVGEYTNNDP